MNWLNIDPALPTLPFVFALDEVAQHFEQYWPAQQTTAFSGISVKQCRRQDVMYIPQTRCVATYALLVEKAGAAPWQTIGVVEVTPDGLKHQLFVDDPQLPGLVLATTVGAMRERLAGLSATPGQARLMQACTITPIRYKPGARCTFRYDLATASGRESCFGKLLAQNSDSLWQTVSALYQASQASSGKGVELPRIAQPLAYWPDLQMLLQPAVAGVELHSAAFDAQFTAAKRMAWVRAAGRYSAALHTLPAHVLPETTASAARPPRTLAADLAELAEYQPALRQVNADLASQFAETMAAMLAVADHQAELAPVVSHGALRTDQFLIAQQAQNASQDDSQGDRLALIDLDSVCWANPARDLGNFLAYLTWKAMRQPQHAAFIQAAQQAFLAGYGTVGQLPDREWLTLYHAASLLKILGRRYTGLTYQEWPLTEHLLNTASKMIKTNCQ